MRVGSRPRPEAATVTDDTFARLRQIAEAAAPTLSRAEAGAIANYIVTFDPTLVLALLDVVEAAAVSRDVRKHSMNTDEQGVVTLDYAKYQEALERLDAALAHVRVAAKGAG